MDQLAAVTQQAQIVGAVLWKDVERATAEQHRDLRHQHFMRVRAALGGAALMAATGSDDEAWIEYLYDSACAIHDAVIRQNVGSDAQRGAA